MKWKKLGAQVNGDLNFANDTSCFAAQNARHQTSNM